MASEVAATAVSAVRRATKEFHGVVVSAGKMDKTFKIKLGGMRYEPRVQKWFKEPRYKLVHDPANSVRQGDVVAIEPSWRVSQHVRHVVKHIIAPYGPGIEERPPVPTMEERVAERAERRAVKDARRAFLRHSAAVHRRADRILLASAKLARIATKAAAASSSAGGGDPSSGTQGRGGGADGPANHFGGVD